MALVDNYHRPTYAGIVRRNLLEILPLNVHHIIQVKIMELNTWEEA